MARAPVRRGAGRRQNNALKLPHGHVGRAVAVAAVPAAQREESPGLSDNWRECHESNSGVEGGGGLLLIAADAGASESEMQIDRSPLNNRRLDYWNSCFGSSKNMSKDVDFFKYVVKVHYRSAKLQSG